MILKEESPIYLIDKSNVERAQPPTVELPLDTLCQDMRQDLDTAILMRPSFSTIQARALLTHVRLDFIIKYSFISRSS